MKINFKERTPQLIAIIAVLVIILAIAVGFLINKSSQINKMEQQFTIDKQELEDEYEAISLQYEGFKFSVQNDSLLYKLENEQAKVQRLQEELRITKATDQAEIKRLKDELGTLRKILKSYIKQIDSLNTLNEQLRAEKEEINQQYRRTQSTLNRVSQEREQLSEKVNLASQLVATNISVTAVNDKGKTQTRLRRSTQFVVNFILARNITAEPGQRKIYARIMTPSGTVLTKSASNVFTYENGEISYSMARSIEYGGEEMPVAMYWDIEEFLQPGTYQVDIFADGNHIGRTTFEMQE